MYTAVDQAGPSSSEEEWRGKLAQDNDLRELVLSTGGQARQRGLVFTSREGWSIAEYDDGGDLKTADGKGEPRSLPSRIPGLKGLAGIARQSRMTSAADAALAGRTTSGQPGLLRRLSRWGAGLFFYLFAVSLFYLTLEEATAVVWNFLNWTGWLQPVLSLIVVIAGILLLGTVGLALSNLHEPTREKWRFHGAEHKVVAAFNRAGPNWREAIRDSAKEHKRCGTNVLFLILASFVVLAVILLGTVPDQETRLVLVLVGFPVVDACLMRLVRHPRFGPLLSTPGLWLQRFNTLEPRQHHIQAATAAASPVFEAILSSSQREASQK